MGHRWRNPELMKMARVAREVEAMMMSGFPVLGATKGAMTQLTGASGSFVPTASGLYVPFLCGGGGGGGGGASATGALVLGSGGSGGAAGSSAWAVYNLTSGLANTFTNGAGGTAGTAGVAAAGTGGDGGTGTNSTFVPSAGVTLAAPGGGGGRGGQSSTVVTAAAISGQVMTLTLTQALAIANGEWIVASGFAGGAWANLNGLRHLVLSGGGSTTLIVLAQSGTIPSGTYTGSSGSIVQEFIDTGIPGGGGPTNNSLIFGPGYGGQTLFLNAGSSTTVGGTGSIGMAGGGGGSGGNGAGGNGGTGGAAGTLGGVGTNGTNGGAGTGAGTAGSAGAANSGAGGGGGGGSTTGNAGAAGGAGGTGYGYVLGPF